MQGTIVNTIAIIIGGLVGLILRKGILDNYRDTVMQGIGLSVLAIGLMGVFKSENIILMIFSVVLGGIIGERIDIDRKLNNLGLWIERKMGSGQGTVAKGFVTASLIFCVGAMAVVGSLESGLTGKHETLYAKSLIDGISSIVFASTLGVGVIFAGAVVFLYQGLITIAAGGLRHLLVEPVIVEMSAIGGLLIVGISLNVLGIKKIPVANMLPAIFVPIVYQLVQPLVLSIGGFIQTLL